MRYLPVRLNILRKKLVANRSQLGMLLTRPVWPPAMTVPVILMECLMLA